MELLKSLEWRYATKKMNGEKVPQDKLERILEATRLAPSSYGLTPYHVIVVEDQKLKEECDKGHNFLPPPYIYDIKHEQSTIEFDFQENKKVPETSKELLENVVNELQNKKVRNSQKQKKSKKKLTNSPNVN